MEKLVSTCNYTPSLAWLRKDRLKPSNLKAAFVRLLEREKKEWKPLILSQTESADEVSPSDRLKALSKQWRTAEILHWETETRFCAAYILDTLLRKVKITPKLLPAVAETALLIAAKITEEDDGFGFVSEITFFGELSLGIGELLRMERILLQKLDWNPRPSLPLDLLQTMHALFLALSGPLHHSSNLGSSFANEYHRFRFGCASAYEELCMLTMFLWEVTQNGKSTRIRPSVLALALVARGDNPQEGQRLWRGNETMFAWFLSAIQINMNDFGHIQRLVEEILHCNLLPFANEDGRFIDDRPQSTSTSWKKRERFEDKKETGSSSLAGLQPEPALCSPPSSLRPTLRPLQSLGRIVDSKKKRRRKCGFRAKGNIRGLIRSSLKISSKISVISKGEPEDPFPDFSFHEGDEPETQAKDDVEAGNLKQSSFTSQELCRFEGGSRTINVEPLFSPTSPDFPGIIQEHLSNSQNDQRGKKMEVCKEEEKITSIIYRPLTYAQVLQLHLAPLKQVLVA